MRERLPVCWRAIAIVKSVFAYSCTAAWSSRISIGTFVHEETARASRRCARDDGHL